MIISVCIYFCADNLRDVYGSILENLIDIFDIYDIHTYLYTPTAHNN